MNTNTPLENLDSFLKTSVLQARTRDETMACWEVTRHCKRRLAAVPVDAIQATAATMLRDLQGDNRHGFGTIL
jgi:hypothetical protein